MPRSDAPRHSGLLRASDFLAEVGNGLRIVVRTRYGLLAISNPAKFLRENATFSGRDRIRDDGSAEIILDP